MKTQLFIYNEDAVIYLQRYKNKSNYIYNKV